MVHQTVRFGTLNLPALIHVARIKSDLQQVDALRARPSPQLARR